MIRFTEEEGEKLLKAASRNKFLPSANSARRPVVDERGQTIIDDVAHFKPNPIQYGGGRSGGKTLAGKSKETSAIEEQFAAQIHCAGLPEPKRQLQYMFAREFKADFAWPQWKFAVEVQGNAHRIKGRFKSDMKRRALLLLDGWTILEVGGDEIRSGIAVKWTEAMIKQMQAKHAG